uniref:Ig-like domain-containing protein n=1 Tax=Electrophorus electricus TaxID=8005 RepID=A0A4W4H1R2_ELEEL
MRQQKGFLLFVLVLELAVLCESRLVTVPDGPLVRVEGQSVSIRCNVSDYQGPRDQDFEWSLITGDGGQDIQLVSTFDPMYTHTSVLDRVESGDISLKKLGEASVELTIRNVRASDSTTYRCSTPSTDSVISGNYYADVELRVIGDTLKVSPAIPSAAVLEGQSVQLHCNASRAYTAHTFLSITWSVRKGTGSPEDILTFGPDEAVRVGPAFTERYADGGLLLDLRGGGVYRMELKEALALDQGAYMCTAREWTRQPGGGKGWQKILEKSEDMGSVTVTPIGQSLAASLSPVSPRFTGDPTELLCNVTDIRNVPDGRLSVTWTYGERRPEGVVSGPMTVATVDELGVLLPGDSYRQRLETGAVTAGRSGPATFRLFVLRSRDQDMGRYSCKVAAWTRSLRGGWDKSPERQSLPVTVEWTAQTPLLNVVAHRVREAATGGSTFEMSCRVTGQNIQNPGYSVLIRFVERQGSNPRKVVSLSADSVLQLEEGMAASRTDSVALEKTGQLEYRFRLYGAQVSDRGFYYCDVTAWTRDQSEDWSRAVSAESNKIEITFTDAGPVFNVSIRSDRDSVSPGDTAQIECTMAILGATPNTGDVAYDVRWFQTPLLAMDNGGAVPLISMDRWGVVRRGSANESAEFSLERTDRHAFVLRLHRAHDRHMGEYHCTARLWYISASGLWREGRELTSAPVSLAVSLAFWDSVQIPVLCGLAAALAAGLLSVVVGLISAHWCLSRSPMHAPRNKLIDLEMD